MSFVDKFLAHYGNHKDYSKTSKFEVLVFAPNALFGTIAPSQDLKFQCETAEIPGYNINTVDGRIYGAPYAVAATPVYSDISLTFICAGDLWEKRFFDDWMQFILPKGDYDYLAEYRDNYVADIQVKSLLETGEVSREFRLIGAFPTSVAPISLNWADDSVNRLSVTFKYTRWEEVGVTYSTGRPLATNVLNNIINDVVQSTPNISPTTIKGEIPPIVGGGGGFGGGGASGKW